MTTKVDKYLWYQMSGVCSWLTITQPSYQASHWSLVPSLTLSLANVCHKSSYLWISGSYEGLDSSQRWPRGNEAIVNREQHCTWCYCQWSEGIKGWGWSSLFVSIMEIMELTLNDHNILAEIFRTAFKNLGFGLPYPDPLQIRWKHSDVQSLKK